MSKAETCPAFKICQRAEENINDPNSRIRLDWDIITENGAQIAREKLIGPNDRCKRCPIGARIQEHDEDTQPQQSLSKG